MRAFFCLCLLVLGLPACVLAQHASASQADAIRNALSAAPPSVSSAAAVMDFQGNTLRPGTNGWVCMPDMPEVPNNSPMCLDAPWLELIDALMKKRKPNLKGIGFGYMLQGDMPVSNVDPFASGPTADNQWLANGVPHIMVVLSDHALLDVVSTDPGNGGPWVMWKGTPYAHIMVPTVPRSH